MQQCKQLVAGGMQIFPDPEGFAACIDSLTCTELEDEASVSDCADWNTSTIKCSGTATLGACSNSGKCTTIDCSSVCSLMQGTFDHCGPDSSRGWDVCWCRQ